MILRKYELYIGENTSVNEQLASPVSGQADNKNKPSLRDVNKADFVRIVDNHIECSISFSKEGKGSKTKEHVITVYNPDDLFLSKAKAKNMVVLAAGYNTSYDLPLIFASDIKSVETQTLGVNKTVKIVCVEAYQARKRINYVKTFNKNTKYKDIINDMISVFASYGVGLGKFTESKKAGSQVNTSKPFTGLITKSMDKICSASGHRWFIASGLLFVEPIIQDLSTIEAYKITEDMVIETVESSDDISNKSKDEQSTKTKGVKFKVFLNGNISVSDGVEIAFGDYQGLYLVKEVRHSLSYEGGEWLTTVEARA